MCGFRLSNSPTHPLHIILFVQHLIALQFTKGEPREFINNITNKKEANYNSIFKTSVHRYDTYSGLVHIENDNRV